MRPNNIAYVSGTHGSGKSTIISELVNCKIEHFAAYERVPIPKSDDTFERTKIRTVRYYFQSFQEDTQASQHPERVLLCDRGILDNWGYMNGFLNIGWVSHAQFEQFEQLYEALFPPERRPHNVVFLDMPQEFLTDNITKRWQTRDKKWREDDFNYLNAVREGFQEFFATYSGNVLHVTSTDLEERVKICKDWAAQLRAD